MFRALLLTLTLPVIAAADVPLVSSVEGQPLAANVDRLIRTLDYFGAPLPAETTAALKRAIKQRDAEKLQQLLDPQAVFVISLNPEVRTKIKPGPGSRKLQQGGFTPLLVKVINDSTVTQQLRIASPQAGPIYSGAALSILQRQAQTELNKNENFEGDHRFLDVQMFQSPPMTRNLSGLEVEYALALIYSSEAGKREATIQFDVGAGTQDIGFRNEVPILFDIRKAVPVKLNIQDDDGRPTAARLTFRDVRGQIYPPQARRLAPDFFFQPQIYRHDGQTVLLPAGKFTLEYSRGPEYRFLTKQVVIPNEGQPVVDVQVKRWVDPMRYGFYCGDHHIHGAGCSHYDNPTKGVRPQDMFVQVKGEGLNVGCVLTWGPCFEFQRNYFSPTADKISEPLTLLKYDLEISGFGSAALGHVCLLNLKDQTYPGSEGTKERGWPTWTVPVLRWCKQQGGVTGYPHSALRINPAIGAENLVTQLDADSDKLVSAEEAASGLLPEPFITMDEDRNGTLTHKEIELSVDRAVDRLPNLAIPTMLGGGALEICVSTAEGVCDFVSAMDTARVSEWNTWYHLMNSGFPLKLSGETDFPCMSSRRVGQGRVYVQMGDVDRLDFTDWCNNIARGRAYVSDGYAHALRFTVNDQSPGYDDVPLAQPGEVTVKATVSFAPEVPKTVAYGQVIPPEGRRIIGDTINLHAPRTDELVKGGKRLVEIVVNGQAVASQHVPADGKPHDLSFNVKIDRSSWVALRHFPQLHTNPVNVAVAGEPIRASRGSARWCAEGIKNLWRTRQNRIAPHERDEAHKTYLRAIKTYERRAAQAPPGS